jgi:hypothetical protein
VGYRGYADALCASTEGPVPPEEHALHSKDIIVNILDTIAFLLVIPEVLIRVRPWLQKGISATWKTLSIILFILILIFSDEVWIDVLPWWFVFAAFVGLAALLFTDSAAYKWLFDKHSVVAKWVADRALWLGVSAFLVSRIVSVFM